MKMLRQGIVPQTWSHQMYCPLCISLLEIYAADIFLFSGVLEQYGTASWDGPKKVKDTPCVRCICCGATLGLIPPLIVWNYVKERESNDTGN